MNQTENVFRKKHPKDSSRLLLSLLFLYTFPLFKKGVKKELTDKDLYLVPKGYESKTQFELLIKKWNGLQKKNSTSVFLLIWNSYGIYYFSLGVVQILVETCLLFFQPFAISQVVSYFVPNQTRIIKTDAYLFAASIILVKVLKGIYEHNNTFWIANLGLRIRTAFFSFIYQKMLKVDFGQLDGVEVGKVVTMITKDVQSFESFVIYGNGIWSSLVSTAIGCIILYTRLGKVSLIGIGVMWIVIPFQIYAALKIAFYEKKMCEKTEKRYRIVKEALSAIRLVKLYTWESVFKTKATKARKSETSTSCGILWFRIVNIHVSALGMSIVLYIFLISYTKTEEHVTAEMIFFIVTCFRLIGRNLSIRLPLALNWFGQLFPCVRRVQNLLSLPEIDTNCDSKKLYPFIQMENTTVILKNVKILDRVSLNLESTGLVVLTGPTSSSKTTFLKTLLMEYRTNGLEVQGSISYASQEPWLFPSTIRQNILFGQKYHEGRYQEVLRLCALDFDLQLLHNGDLTIVEDGGINLSKGQRVRVNLARAIYKNSDIYLLDDCLSSLDEAVRTHILHQCILGFLKTNLVVLVSQNPGDLEWAKKIVTLDKGYLVSIKDKTEQNMFEKSTTEIVPKLLYNELPKEFDEPTKLLPQPKQIYVEKIKSGSVPLKIYFKYFQSGRTLMLLLLVALAVGSTVSGSYNYKLLQNWADLEEQKSINTTNFAKRDHVVFLYGISIVVDVVISIAHSFVFVVFVRRTALKLHKSILRVIDAVMEFFDQHLIGNILNRFSKDISLIDDILPTTWIIFFRRFSVVVSIFVIISTVSVMFLIPSIVFILILVVLRQYYIKTSRNLERLNVATRSPVVGYINSTLDGMTTIRAFGTQTILTSEFDAHLNLHTSASYSLQSSYFAFVLLLEFLSIIFNAGIMIKYLVFDDGVSTAGDVGLVLSQTTMLALHLQVGMSYWADVENYMTSVERVIEYSETEVENHGGSEKPSYGEIKFKNVSLIYPGTDRPVLKALSFSVKPGEKLGIVGRTGAGKSTIFSALCRLYDFQGKISINGIDIKTLSLKGLRSSISLVPQDSVVFSGTIRDNLDPKRHRSDEELWKVLESTNLKTIVKDLDQEGVSFSAGQKQLLSLARALICKNKIVLLDEATANLDQENVSLIRKIIKNNFSTCSVLVIAHTLETILDCDKVLVLQQGVVVKSGKPTEVLESFTECKTLIDTK